MRISSAGSAATRPRSRCACGWRCSTRAVSAATCSRRCRCSRHRRCSSGVPPIRSLRKRAGRACAADCRTRRSRFSRASATTRSGSSRRPVPMSSMRFSARRREQRPDPSDFDPRRTNFGEIPNMKSIVFSTGLRYAALLLLVTDLSGGSPPALAQQQTDTAATSTGAEVETVTVTARKRAESLAEVPTSITAFTAETLKDYNVQSFADYASKTPDLSFTYGGGPTGIADARTIAIRGITGQNLFGTAGATGFYIDDTPVPGSVDPRVLDIDNIEVLKGPQGTLYGESSLGGNVRLVTKKPDVNNSGYGYMLQAGATSGGGSADGGGNFIGNLVLVPGTAAVRMVLFINHDAGYLTRTYPTQPNGPGASDPFATVPRTSSGDQGAMSSGGGSLAMLVKATDNFDIKPRVLFQDSKDHGFPATFAPLPNFTPEYTLNRAFDVQPYATDSWTMPSLDLKYSGSGYTFTWANSYFYRHTQDVEDSSYGTQQILTNSP